MLSEKIAAAINDGKLIPYIATGARDIKTFRDFLEPWEDFFPGQDVRPEVHFSQYGIKLKASPRRHRERIEKPRTQTPVPTVICKEYFDCITGLWEWYGKKGLAEARLLDLPIDVKGHYEFLSKIEVFSRDYYPLAITFEQIEDYLDFTPFPLHFPYYDYNCDDAMVFEAFLSGWEAVASMLITQADEYAFRLHPDDERLVKRVGYQKLCKYYQEFDGEKACDLKMLEDWHNTFFADLFKKYPEIDADNLVVLSDGSYYNEIPLTSCRSIEFAEEYYEAWDNLCAAMPSVWQIHEHADGETEELIHDMCNVWRRGRKQKQVKWSWDDEKTNLRNRDL